MTTVAVPSLADLVAVGPEGMRARRVAETDRRVRDPSGHGWTLREPPRGEPSIAVAVRQGDVVAVDADGGGAWLTGSEGGIWRYADLSAWDATGAPVTAWMDPDPAGLRVRVDPSDARWPITVDPTLLSQGWSQDELTPSSGLPATRFGRSRRRPRQPPLKDR